MKKDHYRPEPLSAAQNARTITDLNDPSAWDMVKVVSSVIARIGYNVSAATLRVEFNSGRIYHYFDVPKPIYEALKTAVSVGSYFNKKVRPRYESIEIVLDRKT